MIRALILLLPLALTGCRKPEITSYIAPKDRTIDDKAPEMEPLPQVAWKLPAGWEQIQAKQMSVATFVITDDKGTATITISPLPNLSGQEEVLVNMWREQVQLGPLSPAELREALQPADVAGGQGTVFEINGTADGKPARIVTAMLHRGDRSWFFKMTGDDGVVTSRKPEFMEFVKSVSFTGGSAQPPAAARAAGHETSEEYHWHPPEKWTVQPLGPMQAAKFSVPEQNGAKADVTVSIFPSESGGTLANVNRWRQQIGLGEIAEAELSSYARPLDEPPGSTLIDLKNENRALLGAIVPRAGRWFYYKLMGDTAAVEAAREDFVAFAKDSPIH